MGNRITMTVLDVFDSPLYPVLVALDGRGFKFRLLPDGVVQVNPIAKLPSDARALFRQHPDELKILVSIATDTGLHARRDAFRGLLDAAAPGTLPGFLFTQGIAYASGSCFSCGDALPELTFARCWRCAVGWRLACRLPVPASLADALDHAKEVG